jgi:hypothetical protein
MLFPWRSGTLKPTVPFLFKGTQIADVTVLEKIPETVNSFYIN